MSLSDSLTAVSYTDRAVGSSRKRVQLIHWNADSQDGAVRRERRALDHLAENRFGHATDLDQIIVRKAGLDAGLVDFRISRIDATWAGLRFTMRK